MAVQFWASNLSFSMDITCSSENSNLTSFRVSRTSGLACAAKSLMKIRMVPKVPKNPLTSVRFRHMGQSSIFWTRDSSGNRPLIVHLWPTTTADSEHRLDLGPEKVPPACLIL